MSPKPYALGGKCRKGHLLTEDNTYTEGTRLRCRDCQTIWKPAKPAPEPKTECPQHHEYTEANTYIDPQGYKQCKTCRNDRMVALRAAEPPGIGQGGFNKAKTRCPKKHEYTPDNTAYSKDGKRRICRTCARFNSMLQNIKKFSITVEQWEQMLITQSGRCSICLIILLDPHVDHDHSCCPGRKSCGKCVRGLTCKPCNIGIGLFYDDVTILQSAIDYLVEHGA